MMRTGVDQAQTGSWHGIPDFNEFGDLPVGRHAASVNEILTRFGSGTPQRQA